MPNKPFDTTQGRPFRPPLLHDHMDGSHPLLSILPELYRLSGKEYPFKGGEDDVRRMFRDIQVNLVEKFGYTTSVMQSPETLELAAYAYTCGRARQGFKYCEATIAPQYHVPLKEGCKNFSELLARHPRYAEQEIAKVISALIAGIKRGEKEFPQIEINIIATVGREVSPEIGVWLVNQFARCDRDYAVAVGLACVESEHPPEKHTAMFRRAKKLDFKTTIHAGEWVNIYPEAPDPERDRGKLLKNMRTAVDLGVDRIGHAIPLIYDKDLRRLIVDKEIGIEGCPGSNLTSGLIPNTAYLGIRDLLKAHVLYSVNPDDDLFLPDLDETFAICDEEYHFTENEKGHLEMNAWETRFGRRKRHRLPFESMT